MIFGMTFGAASDVGQTLPLLATIAPHLNNFKMDTAGHAERSFFEAEFTEARATDCPEVHRRRWNWRLSQYPVAAAGRWVTTAPGTHGSSCAANLAAGAVRKDKFLPVQTPASSRTLRDAQYSGSRSSGLLLKRLSLHLKDLDGSDAHKHYTSSHLGRR